MSGHCSLQDASRFSGSPLGSLAVVRVAQGLCLLLPTAYLLLAGETEYLCLNFWFQPGHRGLDPVIVDRATQSRAPVLTCRSHLVKGKIYYGTHYYSAPVQIRKGAPF